MTCATSNRRLRSWRLRHGWLPLGWLRLGWLRLGCGGVAAAAILLAGCASSELVPAATPATAGFPSATPPVSATAAPVPSSASSIGPDRPSGAATAPGATPGPAAYRLVERRIPMPRRRLDEMRAYSRARYGIDTYRLRPTMIVLHITDSSAEAAIDHFSRNLPDGGSPPGVCTHYLVDKDGTVYELVPTGIMCRHAIGVNYAAIGIEVAQETQGNSARWASRQILARPAQVGALVALVEDLQRRYAIPSDRVIGHAMANADPAFRDATGVRNDHTDWAEAEVVEFRRRLGLGPGPDLTRVPPRGQVP